MTFLERIQNVRKACKNGGRERGNVLVFYVMMFPVFLALTGLAVDGSIVASTQAQLQSSLDAAVQGTVALSKNQTGTGENPRLTYLEAKQNVVRLYDSNRAGMYSDRSSNTGSVPFLQCQTYERGETGSLPSINLIEPGPISQCGFQMLPISYSQNGSLRNGGYLTVTVREKASTIFLQFIGINDLTYTVTSTARLTQSYD